MRPHFRWFAVHVAMVYRLKSGRSRTFTITEDVYLVRARSHEHAQELATSRGRACEDRTGVTIDGRPGELVFGGVRKSIECSPDFSKSTTSHVSRLHSGMEATYSFLRVRGKANLEKYLRGEDVELVLESR